MKKTTKRNIILLSVTAALAVAFTLILTLRKDEDPHSSSYQPKEIEDIATATRSSNAKIVMTDKLDNRVTLECTADGSWTVDGTYPASQPMIDRLLETLQKMRIRAEVNRDAVPNVLKDIAAHGVQVDIYKGSQLIETYFVGRETKDHMASYMLRKGDKIPCEVHIPGFRGYLTPIFSAESIKWRSHNIVDLDVYDIARIELEIPQAQNESFAIIQKENEDFSMELMEGHRQLQGFDTARVGQMLSKFKNLNFDEFASIVPNSLADSCVKGTPRSILRITDTQGSLCEVDIYLKYANPDDAKVMPDPKLREELDVNRLYAIITGGKCGADATSKDTVLIQNYVFDFILQPACYFQGKNITLPTK